MHIFGMQSLEMLVLLDIGDWVSGTWQGPPWPLFDGSQIESPGSLTDDMFHWRSGRMTWWQIHTDNRYPGIPTTIKTMGVNITTIVYLRVLIVQIGSTIILMVVEAQGISLKKHSAQKSICIFFSLVFAWRLSSENDVPLFSYIQAPWTLQVWFS